MNTLNFNPTSRFNEDAFNKTKEIFEKKKSEWLTYSEEAKKYEKKKDEKILISYLKQYGFIAWYIYYEKNIKNHLLFDMETNQWYAYEHTAPFLWSKINQHMLEIAVSNLISESFPFDIYENHKHPKDLDFLISELQQLVSINLTQKSNKNLIVMKNKVFNKEKKQLINNCGPEDFIIQYNTIEYNPDKKCPQIEEWLNFVFKKNQDHIKLFQAICQVILFSNKEYNLNFFVEIRGGGGVGKSLAGRLLQTLVGPHLRTATNLKKLHNSPYETASLLNKNLVLCPDQEAFVSGAEVLKMLTGGDPIRYELKYKNPSQFYFHGIIIILTNAKLIYSSAESAILRRRITFNFDQQIDSNLIDTNLLHIDNENNISGKWQPELSGFLNWVLELSKEDTIDTISKHLNNEKQNVDEFSFLLWLRTTLMPFKEGKLGIMHDKYGPSLYKNYVQFMETQGYAPNKCAAFESNLEKDFQAAFPGYQITKEITKHGKTYIGLMYQSANLTEITTTSDQLEILTIWRNSWKQYFGKTFFGSTSGPTKDQIEIDDNIFTNETLIKTLFQKKNTIQNSIGFPTQLSNGITFNSQVALNLFNQKNIKPEMDKKLIFDSFMNNFEFHQESKLTTSEIYENYLSFINEQGIVPQITDKQIKNKLIKEWNKKYTKLIIQPINNIGKHKKKGILGLKIKEQ